MKFVNGFLTVLGFAALFAAAMGYPTKWLVNYLFSPSLLMSVFGIAQITFWKAFWLNWFLALGRSPLKG
jgi:hypothetical protein